MKKRMSILKNERGHRGQIALVVLLIMVVMLTLGIVVAQRGLFDIRFSAQEEETSRAFQAAETGVEEGLRTLTGGKGSLSGDTNYQVEVAEGGEGGFVVARPVEVGETVAVDLTAASGVTAIDVYFIDKKTEGCEGSSGGAIETGVVEQVGQETRVTKKVVDVVSRNNGFDKVAPGDYEFEGRVFCGLATVAVGSEAIELRVRPWYGRVSLGFDPRPDQASLGNQYRLIHSEGQTGAEVTRAVEVQRTNPQVPSIFDYALFSGASLLKTEFGDNSPTGVATDFRVEVTRHEIETHLKRWPCTQYCPILGYVTMHFDFKVSESSSAAVLLAEEFDTLYTWTGAEKANVNITRGPGGGRNVSGQIPIAWVNNHRTAVVSFYGISLNQGDQVRIDFTAENSGPGEEHKVVGRLLERAIPVAVNVLTSNFP